MTVLDTRWQSILEEHANVKLEEKTISNSSYLFENLGAYASIIFSLRIPILLCLEIYSEGSQGFDRDRDNFFSEGWQAVSCLRSIETHPLAAKTQVSAFQRPLESEKKDLSQWPFAIV